MAIYDDSRLVEDTLGVLTDFSEGGSLGGGFGGGGFGAGRGSVLRYGSSQGGSVTVDDSYGRVYPDDHSVRYLDLSPGEAAKVSEDIATLANQLRGFQDLQVTIDVRFVPTGDYFFERIGVDFEAFDPDAPAQAPRISDANRTFIHKDVDLPFTTGFAPVVSEDGAGFEPIIKAPSDPLNLQIRPYVADDGIVKMVVTTGHFFLKNESSFEIVGGGASGRMGDMQTINQIVGFQPVLVGQQLVDQPIFQQQDISRGSFVDDADIFGFGFKQYFGYQWGLGTNWRYFDGDLRGAWEGDIHVIGRLPIETTHFGLAPYVIAGVGGFFGEENLPIASIGGGLEIRPCSRIAFFAEAKQTWSDEDDMDYSSVVGGARFTTGGIGFRRNKAKVVAPAGGRVLLGGIKRLNGAQNNNGGVPVLGKVPYISRLFRNAGISREQETLMLMVTPKIIIHDEEEQR